MKALLLLVAGIGGLIETLVPRAVVRAWTKALYRNAGEAEPREWVYAATRRGRSRRRRRARSSVCTVSRPPRRTSRASNRIVSKRIGCRNGSRQHQRLNGRNGRRPNGRHQDSGGADAPNSVSRRSRRSLSALLAFRSHSRRLFHRSDTLDRPPSARRSATRGSHDTAPRRTPPTGSSDRRRGPAGPR